MTGDGTNDAPALAQADVGVAMNTGTQAAKEAGNMVDLDSNPTKLIEIVEIGKQMLMTRGSLTTFSIANDVAKYFAIIPAMFVGRRSRRCDALNIMRLHTPAVGDPGGRHLQRADHRRADPPGPRGRQIQAGRARRCSRHNLLIYGVGGVVAPFIGIKLIDLLVNSSPGSGDRHASTRQSTRQYVAALRVLLIFTVIFGVVYPLSVTGVSQLFFGRADGSLVSAAGHVVGSSLIGQSFTDAKGNPLPQ